jgi:hypothetical protein
MEGKANFPKKKLKIMGWLWPPFGSPATPIWPVRPLFVLLLALFLFLPPPPPPPPPIFYFFPFLFTFSPLSAIPTTCILLLCFLLSSHPFVTKATFNLMLPHQHPNPEAVVLDVQRYTPHGFFSIHVFAFQGLKHERSPFMCTFPLLKIPIFSHLIVYFYLFLHILI